MADEMGPHDRIIAQALQGDPDRLRAEKVIRSMWVAADLLYAASLQLTELEKADLAVDVDAALQLIGVSVEMMLQKWYD